MRRHAYVRLSSASASSTHTITNAASITPQQNLETHTRSPCPGARVQDDRQEAELHKEDEEEGEDLCKCEFSLAYGAKILLNNTYLHLKRGKRYGLCGPNGCGKSTLMRAISNGQVEGFPPPEELKTVRRLEEAALPQYHTLLIDRALLHPTTARIFSRLRTSGCRWSLQGGVCRAAA